MSGQAVAVADEMREIRGPSAFGGGVRRFFHLVWVIATTDFKLTYFGSVLGYLWSLMRPLMLFGVLYVVFTKIVRFGNGIPDYPVILLLNIVLFTFFSEATQSAVTCVVNREHLVRKMQFPRMVIPLATVLTAGFTLVANLVVVLVFVVAYGVTPGWGWLLFPLVVLGVLTLTVGVGSILSALYVRFRDVSPIWSVLSTLLFYGTPVIYTIESVPAGARGLALLNPLAALLEWARVLVVDSSAPTVSEAAGWSAAWLPPLAIVVGLLGLGVWFFHRQAPRIAEEL